MQYSKISHYNPITLELLVFEKARLQLVQGKDAVYLAGNLQQFSPDRKEPAKPMYVALMRITAMNLDSSETINILNEDGSLIANNNLRAYPNPFTNRITIDFKLKEKCFVSTQLISLNGNVVYSNTGGSMEAGNYTLPIQSEHIAAGMYIIKLQCGKEIRSVKVIKL